MNKEKLHKVLTQLKKKPYLYVDEPEYHPSMCSRLNLRSTAWCNLQIREIEFVQELRRLLK